MCQHDEKFIDGETKRSAELLHGYWTILFAFRSFQFIHSRKERKVLGGGQDGGGGGNCGSAVTFYQLLKWLMVCDTILVICFALQVSLKGLDI